MYCPIRQALMRYGPLASGGFDSGSLSLCLAPERLGHHRQAQQTQHVLFAGLAEVNTHGQRRDGLHGGAFIKQAKLRHPLRS